MSALTPTAQVITADMLWTLTAQYPADEQRIWRGAEMVALVERAKLPAAPGLFIVKSASDADGAYQVDATTCSCPNFQKVGGMCKHRAAVALFRMSERAETDTEQTLYGLRPGSLRQAAEQLTVRVDPDESILDLWPGEPCDLPAQCSRCHAEAANRRHPDGLGDACISAELFGEEV